MFFFGAVAAFSSHAKPREPSYWEATLLSPNDCELHLQREEWARARAAAYRGLQFRSVEDANLWLRHELKTLHQNPRLDLAWATLRIDERRRFYDRYQEIHQRFRAAYNRINSPSERSVVDMPRREREVWARAQALEVYADFLARLTDYFDVLGDTLRSTRYPGLLLRVPGTLEGAQVLESLAIKPSERARALIARWNDEPDLRWPTDLERGPFVRTEFYELVAEAFFREVTHLDPLTFFENLGARRYTFRALWPLVRSAVESHDRNAHLDLERALAGVNLLNPEKEDVLATFRTAIRFRDALLALVQSPDSLWIEPQRKNPWGDVVVALPAFQLGILFAPDGRVRSFRILQLDELQLRALFSPKVVTAAPATLPKAESADDAPVTGPLSFKAELKSHTEALSPEFGRWLKELYRENHEARSLLMEVALWADGDSDFQASLSMREVVEKIARDHELLPEERVRSFLRYLDQTLAPPAPEDKPLTQVPPTAPPLEPTGLPGRRSAAGLRNLNELALSKDGLWKSIQPGELLEYQFFNSPKVQRVVVSKEALNFIKEHNKHEHWLYAFLRGYVGKQKKNGITHRPDLGYEYPDKIKVVGAGEHVRLAVKLDKKLGALVIGPPCNPDKD